MIPKDIIEHPDPEKHLKVVLGRIHARGPVDLEDLEELAYLKKYHPSVFVKYESRLMYLLGLFYKTDQPSDVVSLAYSVFSDAIREETKELLTPVQASIRSRILKNKYFSFSAPTSAGKSYLLRELILEQPHDIVVIVPSRALLAEYLLAIRDIVGDQKDILVLQFIDDINKLLTRRRIFVVTPERAVEIFKGAGEYLVSLFLFDEAQISEEKERGVSFDALVRRVFKKFPNSKKVFAHPFVENPEAQFSKHGIKDDSDSMSYPQNTVGKLYVGYDDVKNVFFHYSPFQKNLREISQYALSYDLPLEIIKDGGTMLVYVSKASIYNRSFEEKFATYISQCPELTDPEALSIIQEIKEIIGVDDTTSQMVELMKKGVVIHHGSIPLIVRFLIEKFTRSGFARICFATSTLIQGINMPFNLVWIHNFMFKGSDEDKVLGLKNLIGRAGRTNGSKRVDFTFGYVVVTNVSTFIKRLNSKVELTETSRLDGSDSKLDKEDIGEFINALRNNDLSEEYNLPNECLSRLKSDDSESCVQVVLELLFDNNKIITGSKYRSLPQKIRSKIKFCFSQIFESSLKRKLSPGEKSILSTAVTILLWQIQGKTFREILGLRYGFLTQREMQGRLRSQYAKGELTKEEFEQKVSALTIGYTPIASILPNSKLRSNSPSLFDEGMALSRFNYDLLVYDTYDYLDKVISFSLSDVFVAAFDCYFKKTNDLRARIIVDCFRYGTSDRVEILLLRYGYSFEEIKWIKNYVESIDEDRIVFSSSISELNLTQMELIKKYL